MALSASQIKEILTAGSRSKNSSPGTYFYTVGEDGKLVKEAGKPKQPSVAYGAFEGKVGSIRRTKKGNYRLPNGRRKYRDDEAYVVAYKV